MIAPATSGLMSVYSFISAEIPPRDHALTTARPPGGRIGVDCAEASGRPRSTSPASNSRGPTGRVSILMASRNATRKRFSATRCPAPS